MVGALTVGGVLAVVLALLALRPRPALYGLGAASVLLAMLGLWLTSPSGGRWLAAHVLPGAGTGSYGTWVFAPLLLFFPTGWLLLAASVTTWRAGLVWYLAPGLLLLVLAFAAGWFGPPGLGPGQTPPWIPIALVVAWPAFVLIAAGVFGHTLG